MDDRNKAFADHVVLPNGGLCAQRLHTQIIVFIFWLEVLHCASIVSNPVGFEMGGKHSQSLLGVALFGRYVGSCPRFSKRPVPGRDPSQPASHSHTWIIPGLDMLVLWSRRVRVDQLKGKVLVQLLKLYKLCRTIIVYKSNIMHWNANPIGPSQAHFKMLPTRAETVSMGMAKPMPADAPLGEKMAVFIPMTWRKLSRQNDGCFRRAPVWICFAHGPKPKECQLLEVEHEINLKICLRSKPDRTHEPECSHFM